MIPVRKTIRTLAMTLITILTGTSCGRTPPDIVLIMIDTLRSDHLSCYGAAELSTPRIDELARNGFVFTEVHAAAPTTLASTTSLFTSLHPRMHGTARNGFKVDDSLLTLAEVLKENGYYTAAFVASIALHSDTNIDQGFDTFDQRFTDSFDSPQLQRRAGEVTDSVAEWLDTGSPRPFFLFVHYFDPHQPYQPPEGFRPAPAEGEAGQVTGSMSDVRSLRREYIETGIADERIERLHDLYIGEVRYTDRETGRLLDLLEEKGLTGEALIVLTADHGETFLEHGANEVLNHGFMVYSTTTHIPLIFRQPGEVPVGKSDVFVSNIDIAPTVLDLAGLVVPPQYTGASLTSIMRGEPAEKRPVFSEATKPYGPVEAGTPFRNDRKAKCVILQGRKLVWMPLFGDHEELYDLREDPLESTDLLPGASSDDQEIMRMRTILRQWASRSSEIARERAVELDGEMREKLEALGYVDDTE